MEAILTSFGCPLQHFMLGSRADVFETDGILVGYSEEGDDENCTTCYQSQKMHECSYYKMLIYNKSIKEMKS